MHDDFEMWLAEVDRHLTAKVGLSTGDLGDQCYYDWFDDEITPAQAARLVLESEGF